jgi:hypothetical protein
MRTWMLVLAWLSALVAPAAAMPDPGGFDRLLAAYVRPGADGVNRVDYARWKASAGDRAALRSYIAAMEAERPSTLPRAAAFAYWANLYNAATVEVVLANYPVRSIRDIGFGGPWKTKRLTVEGRALSLDDVEHRIMRPTFRDPRVHYALNCASIGCPDLPRRAWRAETLEAGLDAAARAYVAHPRGVEITPGGLRLSSIYRWYAEDFGDLRAHLARYATPERAAAIRSSPRIAGYGYDWRLNGTETP